MVTAWLPWKYRGVLHQGAKLPSRDTWPTWSALVTCSGWCRTPIFPYYSCAYHHTFHVLIILPIIIIHIHMYFSIFLYIKIHTYMYIHILLYIRIFLGNKGKSHFLVKGDEGINQLLEIHNNMNWETEEYKLGRIFEE